MRRGIFRDQRGQNLIEFAMVVPVILLVLTGTIDLGRAVALNVALDNASRVGAQQKAIEKVADATASGRINSEVSNQPGYIAGTNPGIAYSTELDSASNTIDVVQVTFTFTPTIRWPGLPASHSFVATQKMRRAP